MMMLITTSITIHSALVTQGKGKNINDHGHHHHLAVTGKYAGTSSFPVIPYPDLEFYQVEYFIPTPELDLHSLSFFRQHISFSEQKHLRETSGHYSRASAHILVTLGNLVGLMGEIHNFLLYSAFLRLDG